ncbi:hypothetical protein Hanom_Chr05g00429791 [Helianthus anomalus]
MGVDLKKSKISSNYLNCRFSFLGFSSMTPKTSESMSHDEALYFKWNKTSFELLLQTFCIRPEWHPVMPSERDTAFPLMDNKITLFAFFQVL